MLAQWTLVVMVAAGASPNGPPTSVTANGPSVADEAERWASRTGVSTAIAELRPGASGLRRVEIRGSVEGIPLAAPIARALVDPRHPDRAVLWVSPDALPDVPAVSRPHVVSREQALDIAERSGIAGSTGATAAELVVIPTAQAWRAVWRIDPPADLVTLRNIVVYVDASSGRISVAYDRTRFAAARAFVPNPVVAPDAVDVELEAIDTPVQSLQGPWYRTVGCVQPDTGPTCAYVDIGPSQGQDFLYPAPDVATPADNEQLEDEFAAVSVYAHADLFQTYIMGLGLPGLPCHVAGQPATLAANYKGYSADGPLFVGNAAYVGDCDLAAVFGQGEGADWGYDGDVVYHELTHGVIEERMGPGRVLGFADRRPEAVVEDAGAIAEAVADFVSNVVAGDSVHGDYVAMYGNGDGRDAENDSTCPASMVGQVHYDSQALTAALWDAYAEIGDPLVGVVLDAVGMLPEDAAFEDMTIALQAVGEAVLDPSEAEVLSQALSARGLDDCPRIVAGDAFQGPLWIYPKGMKGVFTPMRPPAVQLAFDVPPGSATMTVTFAIEVVPTPGWEPVADVHALIKADAPITFSYEQADDVTTVDADSDAHLPSINEGTFTVDVADTQTMHVAFFNLGVNVTRIGSVVATFTEGGGGTGTFGTTGGTGVTSTDTSTSTEPPPNTGPGCACGSDTRVGAWWLVALVVFGRRK